MSGECNLCGWIGHGEKYCPTLQNEGPPNVDVPLEHQTKECLIALVEAMDKQAKDNEKRTAALEKVWDAVRRIRYHHEQKAEDDLIAAGDELNEMARQAKLTPAPKEEGKS